MQIKSQGWDDLEKRIVQKPPAVKLLTYRQFVWKIYQFYGLAHIVFGVVHKQQKIEISLFHLAPIFLISKDSIT